MNTTINAIQGQYADCVTEKGDRVIIKMIDPSQHQVGDAVNWWTEYAATKADGTTVYEEVVAPTYIDEDGNKGEAPEPNQFSREEYLIALVEVMSVAVFESAKIEMDLEGIRLLATAQAAKNRG